PSAEIVLDIIVRDAKFFSILCPGCRSCEFIGSDRQMGAHVRELRRVPQPRLCGSIWVTKPFKDRSIAFFILHQDIMENCGQLMDLNRYRGVVDPGWAAVDMASVEPMMVLSIDLNHGRMVRLAKEVPVPTMMPMMKLEREAAHESRSIFSKKATNGLMVAKDEYIAGARAFASAASAIGRYVERRPWPCGITSQTVNNLQNTWGLPRCAGLPWRPLLLHPDAVETFFNAAGNVIYASDADFFNQEPPLLVPSRESFWDEQVRRVPIYVRREERRGHEHVPQLQWCIQGDASSEAVSVSTKLSKKVTDWMKKQTKVAEHNRTAAERKRHWIVLPEPPDPSLSGDQYVQLVQGLKVHCLWCKREREPYDDSMVEHLEWAVVLWVALVTAVGPVMTQRSPENEIVQGAWRMKKRELAVGAVMAAMDDEVEAVVAIVGYATPEVVLWYPGNVIVPVAWIWKSACPAGGAEVVITQLCAVVNLLAQGRAPDYVAPVLAGAGLALESQSGMQQCDPLGPLLFSVGLQPIASELRSCGLDIAVHYLDDGILAGDVSAVSRALQLVQRVQRKAGAIGLAVNLQKCQVVAVGAADQAGDLLDALGELPDPQVGLRLLRACGGFARLVHSMRCNPSVPQQTALSLDMFDGMVRRSFGDLTGVHPNGLQWQQAGLGFAYGGLGLRSTSDHAPAAYLASLEPPCSQPLTSMPASAWTLLKPPLKLLLLCPLSTTAFPLGRLLLWRRPWLPPNTTFLTAWILLWDEQLLQASLVSRATLRPEASQVFMTRTRGARDATGSLTLTGTMLASVSLGVLSATWCSVGRKKVGCALNNGRRPADADVYLPAYAGSPAALDFAITAPQRQATLAQASHQMAAAATAYARQMCS
ncbi:unnamed protein product, partial [Cladocopium goreaui]